MLEQEKIKSGLSNIDRALFWADEWLEARRIGQNGKKEDRHLTFAYARLSNDEKEKYWKLRNVN